MPKNSVTYCDKSYKSDMFKCNENLRDKFIQPSWEKERRVTWQTISISLSVED